MKVYVASRASIPERTQMWRDLKELADCDIISSRIFETGANEPEDYGELWLRIQHEISSCDRLVLYVEHDDFPLKGALVEVGMALALNIPVWVVSPRLELEGRTFRPLGSWIAYPSVRVQLNATMDDIIKILRGHMV